MVTSKATLEKIKKIIEKNYKTITISMLGKKVFTPSEIKQLKDFGIDTDAKDSYLEMVYYHNYLNSIDDPNKPNSLEELKAQQSREEILPKGEAHDYAIETLNENAKQLIEKLEADFTTKVSNIIRANNDNYKANALQNLDRSDSADELVKEATLPKVKREINELRDSAVSDWKRVTLTEMNNAIGAGSVDRIVVQNPEKDLNDIFVYRIPVNDAKTCIFCKKFYLDPNDGTYKIYKLSQLLNNGSNYGKKQNAWLPVIGSTHPNTRTSQIIELRPGWKLVSGGAQTFIGLEEWQKYIAEKLS